MPEQEFTYSYKGKLFATSKDFRSYFLLLFAKELIKHSIKDFDKLEHTIKRKEKIHQHKETKKEQVPKNRDTEKYILSLMHRHPHILSQKEYRDVDNMFLEKKALPKKTREILPQPRVAQRPLFIPETRLHPELQYLKPYRTNLEIDLGKLAPLANDPNVKIIECNGPDEKIIVKGAMGTKPTRIILTKKEIASVIHTFSQSAKIPANEGIVKIAYGKFVLSAIVSEIIGSKFILRKIPPQQQLMPQPIRAQSRYF